MFSTRSLLALLVAISASSVVNAEYFSNYWKRNITAEHNRYRSTLLKYPAADMQKLQWSRKIEISANKWALYLQKHHACDMKHPHEVGVDKYPYGQNLAWQRDNWSYNLNKAHSNMISTAMWGWGAYEIRYLIPQLEAQGLTGRYFGKGFAKDDHYNQIVWSRTTHIGCAYVICGNERTTVCEFGPPGNVFRNKKSLEWYIRGKPCSACPKGQVCDASGYFCVNPRPVTYNAPPAPKKVAVKAASKKAAPAKKASYPANAAPKKSPYGEKKNSSDVKSTDAEKCDTA